MAKNGQALLPMVELIEESKLALDELIDVLGRVQIEAVLRLSAERIAGPPHPGKKGGAIGWHGRERGTICLKERKLRLDRPRLRKKDRSEDGEVPVPAYEAMRSNERLGGRMLEILLWGVSTRQYCRWRDGKMVLRWAAAAWLMTEKNFRKMMGYRDLWMLEAALGIKSAAPPEKVA